MRINKQNGVNRYNYFMRDDDYRMIWDNNVEGMSLRVYVL